jgi:biotin transporter BioY
MTPHRFFQRCGAATLTLFLLLIVLGLPMLAVLGAWRRA